MMSIHSTIKDNVALFIEFVKKQIVRPKVRKILKSAWTKSIVFSIPYASFPMQWALNHIHDVEKKEEDDKIEKRKKEDNDKMEKKLELFCKVAVANNPPAQYNFGLTYAEGKNIDQDWNKAREWFEKAADGGNAQAQCNLGLMYKTGEGVAQDWKKAIEWFEKAAYGKNLLAQCNLGFIYREGKGVEQDLEKSIYWFNKATAVVNAITKSKN